jgi:PHD/YefM family antitoxin component YafN of YafNO toxin-antitoxin module
VQLRLTLEPNLVPIHPKPDRGLSQGWILAGEDYSKPKLTDMLFTVALTSKLSAEAGSAVKAVALLIGDLAEEDFSASLADEISNKIVASIDELKNQVNSTKEFLAVTSHNQASAILNIQKVAEANMELAKKLTEATDKIATRKSNTHQLSSST